jgi:hypothetical protein
MQISQFIQQMLHEIRTNPAVSTDYLVENYKGQWGGIKHALFTAHLNMGSPMPIDLADAPEITGDSVIVDEPDVDVDQKEEL